MSYRVLVADGVDRSGLGPLVSDTDVEVVMVDDSTSEEFDSALATADALIVRSATRVGGDLLAKAPRLKAVGRAGVGVDNIDIPAASERGIAVFNAPGGNTIAAAELTMALLISVARNVPAAEASLRSGQWDRPTFKGVELKGKTLGLIGAGRIGSEVALRSQAFGMKVIASDPYLSPTRAEELNVELTSLNDVIERADFISLHVPLTEETKGMWGQDEFRRMKKTAFVVNAARVGVIDEVALAKALHSGTIAGAALDVYEQEPLPADSPLRDAPNLMLTPHLGASTAEAQVGVATEVAQKIRLLLETGNRADALNAAEIG
ncbi:MAG TPA: hydroxyacid dehydrogenase [Acidimicrobiia bacterium]|nr:hydroxyacid dehydrogenase [Acidimicrobiia bacterium]